MDDPRLANQNLIVGDVDSRYPNAGGVSWMQYIVERDWQRGKPNTTSKFFGGFTSGLSDGTADDPGVRIALLLKDYAASIPWVNTPQCWDLLDAFASLEETQAKVAAIVADAEGKPTPVVPDTPEPSPHPLNDVPPGTVTDIPVQHRVETDGTHTVVIEQGGHLHVGKGSHFWEAWHNAVHTVLKFLHLQK